MGKIIFDQYIFCDSFDAAKKVSKAFQGFRFKFHGLGKRQSVYAKRFIRKTPSLQYHPYKVIVRFQIDYDGEFEEYGFLDRRTKNKYPELAEKLSSQDDLEKINTLSEYECLEDEICKDIYYYNNFNEFFESKLKPLMNKIYIACVIAFANMYRMDGFAIYYQEMGTTFERAYFADQSSVDVCVEKYFSVYNISPLDISLVWGWMQKHHKYKKDTFMSVARPLTTLTYAMNRSNIERIFYAVVGFESVYTKSEKFVRQQLKDSIPIVFPSISKNDIDMFYTLRSDFAHGDIEFPDYYNAKYHWNNLDDIAQKATSLLIMTVRELALNNAIKIRVDAGGNTMFLKHQVHY